MRVLQGTGVSPGVNAGKPINIERTLDFSIAATISLDEGIKELTAKYKSIIDKYNSSSREIEAEVLEAYILILNDPELINSLSELNEANLEQIYNVFLEQSEVFKQMDDEYFQQRSEDIEAIGKELIFTLQDISIEFDADVPQVIFANELTPNETSSMNLNLVKGFVVKEGGPTSHAVIVAKNYGIPCILGISIADFDIDNVEEVIINGSTGELTINPDESSLKIVEEYKATTTKQLENYTEENLNKLGVELRANIGSTDEIKSFKKKVGVSLNPNTEINIIENELKNVDLILVMSVYPGFGGQKFIPDVIKKIELLKKLKDDKNYEYDIEVDGGINFSNSKDVINAGANILVSGTTIFKENNGNIKKNIETLKEV